ncbi:MAG TPA: GAF domain-containing protein, partial [Anaerolineales bacterium]|nr:GAF domain-containing protein [Anaerolineales bacterium]
MSIQKHDRTYQAAGDRARSAYLWVEAIRHYSAGLADEILDPQVEYALLAGRQYCHQRIAQFDRAARDLERMAEIGAALSDVEQQLEAMTERAYTLAYHQEVEEARQAARDALQLAEENGSEYYAARAVYGLGLAESFTGGFLRGAEYHAEARAVFQRLGKSEDEAWCLYNLAFCAYHTGHDPLPIAEEMWELVSQLNDPLLEARSLQMLSIANQNEPARLRHYLENSLEIFSKIDERSGILAITHNLGLFYFNQGAIKRGFKLFNRSLALREEEGIQRSALLPKHMAAFTGYLAGEDPGEMLALNLNVFQEASDAGERSVRAYAASVRGIMLHLSGRNREAEKWHLRANELLETLPGYIPNNMAWLSYAYLAMGKTEQALRTTTEAIERAEEMRDTPFFHNVLWAHYLATQAAAGDPVEISDADWDLLDRAAGIILETGEKVHDPGLRRNFLIRGRKTTDLLVEWTSQAYARGISLERLSLDTSLGEDLRVPFKRLIEFGNRLTSQRSLKDLPEFIMEELIELSGAERAFITLTDGEKGTPLVIRTYEVSDDEIQQIRDESADALDRAALSHQPVLQNGIGEIPGGEPPPLHLRSVLILPLVQAGEVMGTIYL